MKDTTTNEDFSIAVEECLIKVNLTWNKIVSIITDGCPSLTEKNVGLLKRISDIVKEMQSEQDILFSYYIIHQEVLCRNHISLKITRHILLSTNRSHVYPSKTIKYYYYLILIVKFLCPNTLK